MHGLSCRSYDGERGLYLECLAVIGHYFGRTIYDGSAQFEYRGVFKGFQDYFVAYAVDITLGDAYFYSVLFHYALSFYFGFYDNLVKTV